METREGLGRTASTEGLLKSRRNSSSLWRKLNVSGGLLFLSFCVVMVWGWGFFWFVYLFISQ